MRYPVYWARATFIGRDDEGHPVHRWAWGWSSESEAAAQSMAQQRAELAVRRANDSEPWAQDYGYGVDPAREEVLDSLSLDGKPIAAITRNRYGCEVLNAYTVLFADIDVARPRRKAGGSFWSRLFRKSKPAEPTPTLEQTFETRIRAWHADRADVPLRAYRTAAGYRVVLGDRLYVPDASDTRDLMKSLGSDALYVILCARQRTFRARLSPKPWRCGLATPRGVFPYRHAADEAHQRQWESVYAQQSAKFATCEHVFDLGPAITDPVILETLRVHDEATLRPGRPLA